MKTIKLKSERFCLTCNDYRIFRYDPVFKHSKCEVCGKHWASKYPSVEWYEDKIKKLERKNDVLKIEIENLKRELKSLKEKLKEYDNK